MAKKRLLVDMDGTLARFHDQDMFLERMYEKGFFNDLEPFYNMVDAVRDIVRNHAEIEVYIVSAKVIGEPPYCVAEKHAWLDRFLPEIDRKHRIFTDIGHSKAEYMPCGVTKDDYLLDDYNKGLNLFLADGGSAIKVMNNINMRGLGAYGGDKGHMWTGPLVTTETSPDIIVGDLLEYMGLPRDKEKELTALGIQQLQPNDWYKKEKPGLYLTEYPDGTTKIGLNQTCVPHYCASFGDAIKCLAAMRNTQYSPLNFQLSRELHAFDSIKIITEDAKTHPLILPKWKLAAVCKNLGIEMNTSKNEVHLPAQDKSRIEKELENSCKPIYGRIDTLDSVGNVIISKVYYDPNELLQDIEKAGRDPIQHKISVEWYLHPNREESLPQLKNTIDTAPRALSEMVHAAEQRIHVQKSEQAPSIEKLRDL